jgi:hypothetical protein
VLGRKKPLDLHLVLEKMGGLVYTSLLGRSNLLLLHRTTYIVRVHSYVRAFGLLCLQFAARENDLSLCFVLEGTDLRDSHLNTRQV